MLTRNTPFPAPKNLLCMIAVQLQFANAMNAAREMFGRSYFSLGAPETAAVHQAVLAVIIRSSRRSSSPAMPIPSGRLSRSYPGDDLTEPQIYRRVRRRPPTRMSGKSGGPLEERTSALLACVNVHQVSSQLPMKLLLIHLLQARGLQQESDQ